MTALAIDSIEGETLEEQVTRLEKANSGLYAEVRSERERRKAAEAELATAQGEAGDPAGLEAVRRERDEALQLARDAYSQIDKLVADRSVPAGPLAGQPQPDPAALEHGLRALNESAGAVRVEHQDFDQVLEQARDIRSRMVAATHSQWTEDEVRGSVELGDALQSLQSLQQGVSPAARAYELASRIVRALQPEEQVEEPTEAEATPELTQVADELADTITEGATA